MRQLTILVDVDDVLDDLTNAWVNAVNVKYGMNVKPDDIKSWDIETYFDGLSRNQVFSPLHKEYFWDDLKPIEGAQEYLKRLIDDGHTVVLVTSSHPNTVKFKYDFLVKYFPYIAFRDIIFTSRKQMVKGDVLIDDAPHNLEGGEYAKILMKAPHNSLYDAEANGMQRADNWEQIYSIIDTMAQG